MRLPPTRLSEDNKDYIDRQETHEQIAEYYWAKFHKDWKGCDEYGLNNLAVHLYESLDYRRLNALIEQGWMNARVERGDYTYTGFLSDVDLSWRMADSLVEQDETKLTDCFRHALIQTSINSISGSYSPELIARALEEREWTPKRAFSVAARVPDAGKAVKMYQAILRTSKLDADDRFHAEKRGLEAAQAIGAERYRAEALAALAPHLSGEKKAEALEAARNMANGGERAFAVSAFLTSMDSSASLRATADCLRWVQNGRRRRLLQLSHRLFPIGSLDTEIMDLISQRLIEVCYEWRWL